jgi:hypothetical protein
MWKVKAKLTDARSVTGNFPGTMSEALNAFGKLCASHKLNPENDVTSLKVERIESDSAFKLSKPRAEKPASKGKK